MGSASVKTMQSSRGDSSPLDIPCVGDILPEEIRNASFSRSFGGLRQQDNAVICGLDNSQTCQELTQAHTTQSIHGVF
jgi:hypothetical protein